MDETYDANHSISSIFLIMGNFGRRYSEPFSLDGTVNQLQSRSWQTINFQEENSVFPHLLIWTDVWKGFGYNSIIFLAAIASSIRDYMTKLYDGWSFMVAKVRRVTIPGMMPFHHFDYYSCVARILGCKV